MQRESEIRLSSLKADGGAANNNFLMQFQADITGVPVMRPACVETTALGAAYLAGLARGFWPDMAELRRNWKIDRVFEPAMTALDREKMIAGWKKAVTRSFDWDR